jgi:hypothetical protein
MSERLYAVATAISKRHHERTAVKPDLALIHADTPEEATSIAEELVEGLGDGHTEIVAVAVAPQETLQ